MKGALVDPAATVTFTGTVTFAFPLVSATANPPAGAIPLKVTIHAAVPGAFTVAGLQLTPLNCATGAAGDTVTAAVFTTVPVLAVTVTVCTLATAPAVAVKVPVVAPEETVTLACTGSAVLLLDRLTVNPLPVAALVNVTVQVVVCADHTLAGTHATDDNCGGAEALRVKVCDTPAALAVNSAV